MYKTSDIKPKRYPEEKPDAGTFWIYTTNDEWVNVGLCPCSDYKGFTWFIPVPGAPSELKPLAYPEHKPSETGVYWALDKSNLWIRAIWDDIRNIAWDEVVDWFIPYNLEPSSNSCQLEPLGNPEQLKEKKVSDVIWSSGEIQIEKPKYSSLLRFHQVCDASKIVMSQREFNEIARHWLDLQGYDVVKREPELLACPNPECKCDVDVIQAGEHSWYCECEECAYSGPLVLTQSEAIRLHNLIAGKEG